MHRAIVPDRAFFSSEVFRTANGHHLSEFKLASAKGSESFMSLSAMPWVERCRDSGMSRKSRSYLSEVTVHMVQRGNNRTPCFTRMTTIRCKRPERAGVS